MKVLDPHSSIRSVKDVTQGTAVFLGPQGRINGHTIFLVYAADTDICIGALRDPISSSPSTQTQKRAWEIRPIKVDGETFYLRPVKTVLGKMDAAWALRDWVAERNRK